MCPDSKFSCVHAFIRHVTETGYPHGPLLRRRDGCRLQHYHTVLITNALSLHLHFSLNLFNLHISFFHFDTISASEPPCNILFPPDALSIQERRLIVEITLYPDDPDAWEWVLDDASLFNRDAT